MTNDPAQIAAMYFEAWRANDFDTLRSILADDVQFTGPLAKLTGADGCVRGLRRMSEIKTDIVIHRIFHDGNAVLTWFELHTTVAPPAPVANWSHVQDGTITRIHVTFDPRGILQAPEATPPR